MEADFVTKYNELVARVEKLVKDRDVLASTLMGLIEMLHRKKVIHPNDLRRLMQTFSDQIDQNMTERQDDEPSDE
jgi:hypothetical protein